MLLKSFKSYFLRGMAALMPTILSVWLFVWLFRFLRDNVSRHINMSIVKLFELFSDSDDEMLRQQIEEIMLNGSGQVIGYILPLLLVCVLGAILASVVGKTLWKLFDRALHKVPLIKRVYPYLKQITDFALADGKMAFKKVVAVEYPRKGIWAMGLVTGAGVESLVKAGSFEKNQDFVTIFIPSSPTPFTGYVIIVEKEDVIELDVSIEEALRFTVSGGVITPTRWREMQLESEM